MTEACAKCGEPCDYVAGKTVCCGSPTMTVIGKPWLGWGGNRRLGPRKTIPPEMRESIDKALKRRLVRLHDIYRASGITEYELYQARHGQAIPAASAIRLMEYVSQMRVSQ